MFAALYEARTPEITVVGYSVVRGARQGNASGAMQAKISSPEALSKFAEAGYYPVSSAWFSGDSRLPAETEPITLYAQQMRIMSSQLKNDVAFPVGEVAWAIAMDTGDQGEKECRKVALTLCGKFNVDPDQIRIVDPIPGYETIKPDGYDDADKNPEGMMD